MKLTGMTRNSTNSLEDAILNVSRKLKMNNADFWDMASRADGGIVRRLDDMATENKIDMLIDLSKKLYK